MWGLLSGLLLPVVSWWLERQGMEKEEVKRFLAQVKMIQNQNRSATTEPADSAKLARERLRRMESEMKEK